VIWVPTDGRRDEAGEQRNVRSHSYESTIDDDASCGMR